jgi:hypothetical protein
MPSWRVGPRVYVGSEFAFELRVCQWAERHWPPDGDRGDVAVLVARQLGVRERRWDTLVLECDPEALANRIVFGEDPLDSDLLHVVRHAPADWAWYRDALPDPGYPWQYVREAVHRAADRDVVETRKGTNGRIELRRRWRYPEFVERVVAIENKPDLDASAARALAPQLERDVALGLADEVWVATEPPEGTIAPALLEDLPVEAGILTVDPTAAGPGGPSADAADVAWHPRTLDAAGPGTRILENPRGGGYDASAARFEYVDASWKAAKRREIAERAYAHGWRRYVDSLRPDCRHFRLCDRSGWVLPYCEAKECVPDPGTCRHRCADRTPEPPAWRKRDWPLEGGPGKAIQRVLARQRRRQRPAPEE